jgi:DNA-binding transcriptional ArsR family regulator
VTFWSHNGVGDSQDAVFKALADPTRREILDLLFVQDGRTVGELCDAFGEQMSRFGVMKHVGVLAEADLVVAVRAGRTKRLHLNPVPIEQVANRWISKYAARFTSALVGLQQHVEAQDPTNTGGTAS